MTYWYELTPVDTLFFRGNEPMEAGLSAGLPLFPPPVSALTGAFRTAFLKQRNIAFSEFKAGRVSDVVTSIIGESGAPAPFSVIAVALRICGKTYVSSPDSIFVDTQAGITKGSDYSGLKPCVAAPLDDIRSLDIVTSVSRVPYVKTRHEARSLAGTWMNIETLANLPVTFAASDILVNEELVGVESRTGIGLDANRVVRKGALYSANHVRLREGVTMLVALDKDTGLNPFGSIRLGGEMRSCWYKSCAETEYRQTTGKSYCSLVPIQASEENLKYLICSKKLQVTAGWDLARQFHKPSSSWIPAGAVFSINITGHCVALDF